MRTPLPTKITIPEHALYQEVENEAVILNLENEHYFGLNQVGRDIWREIAEHGDAEKVVSALLEKYDVDEARLREDITKLVDELREEHLIAIETEDATP